MIYIKKQILILRLLLDNSVQIASSWHFMY